MIFYGNNVVNVRCENGFIIIDDWSMDVRSVERVNITNNTNYALQIKTYTKDECDNMFSRKNTTITHFAPIDENESIDSFNIGSPCFMSGKVYKQYDNKWIPSTTSDRTDCICSVVNTGDHKTFAGVVVSVDKNNNSLTFASHGDFLFSVDDSTDYEIGDVILYNGMILDEDITLTLKHQRSIVGVDSAIIDEHTVSIFRE